MFEWHCEWAALAPILRPYLQHAAAGRGCGTVAIIGAGSSSLGLSVLADGLGYSHLLLLDVCGPTEQPPSPKADMLVMDVTKPFPFLSSAASAMLDKGTLDALSNEEARQQCLSESMRFLQPSGLFFSISFLSRRRIQFLAQQAGQLGLSAHLHLVGKGDPARGNEVG
jgi:hypothetical protein